MATKLISQMLLKLLSWIVLRTRSDTTDETEILVLRHQLAVLQRRTPRPRISWTDRAMIAALARLLPARRRYGLLVTPATILRWHRQLVAPPLDRPTRAGRPTCHSRRCPRPDRAPGHRKSALGVSARVRRTRRTRLPDRRLHRVEDAPRGGHRPGVARAGRPGPGSSTREPRRSRPATCSRSTQSACTGSTRSSSSSTPPAGYTSWA